MASSPGSTTSPDASQAPVKEGDILASKYRVEKVLGIGGMGVVVAAHHVDLDQKVALKFLLPQAASNDDLVNRFLREARASVRLKGLHVAKTLDVGRLEDGCPYIVMEFLDGHDLHAEIRSKGVALPIDIACSYVLQAAEGLAEAHSLGIVHRDLKPGNLFLTRGVDGRPLVKVLDFGISKTMDKSIVSDGLSLTKTEMLLGSPLYMSPEQMRSSKHVDERSDLWALGAIAYELLTTKVPFEADSILELCFKVAQENAPNPQMWRPELPDALAAAVLKCLQKNADDRFSNVGELARAFEPFALARDRGTAERALDVLGAGKRPFQRSMPAPALSANSTAATVVEPSTPRLGESGATPAPGVPQSSKSELLVAPPAAAWGTTQAHAAGPAKSRKGIIAIAAGFVVAGALAAVVVVSKKGGGDGVVAAGGGSAMPTAPASANATSPPVPAPVPLPVLLPLSATADQAADAGTNGPAAAAATPTAAGHTGVGTAKPVARPVASAKGPKPAGSGAGAATAAPTVDQGGFIKVRE